MGTEGYSGLPTEARMLGRRRSSDLLTAKADPEHAKQRAVESGQRLGEHERGATGACVLQAQQRMIRPAVLPVDDEVVPCVRHGRRR